MNDVSIHVPYIFGNKQNSLLRREKTVTEGRQRYWYQERPAVGSNRPEREAKLTHSNLQISKCLCIIIRTCHKYKC